MRKIDFSKEGPQFKGASMWPDLQQWVWKERLPWLVKKLNLSAGQLLSQIDWTMNSVFIVPPGEGKNTVLVPAGLQYFVQIYVVMPSVVMVHKGKDTLDLLYHEQVGGCATSQRIEDDLIDNVTTGVLQRLIRDKNSPLWKGNARLFIDEAHRIINGQDLETEFQIGVAAKKGIPISLMSATINPAGLDKVYDAKIYQLKTPRFPLNIQQVHDQTVEQFLKAKAKSYCDNQKTMLIFRPTRALVVSTANYIRNLVGEEKVGVVTITGTDDVDQKQAEMNHWLWPDQKENLVIVATPGVMDSGVNIPELRVLLIDDQLITVEENKYNYPEMKRQPNPNKLLWQMIYRVGRVERAKGEEDEVYLFTAKDRSEDLDFNTVQFEKITGAKPWAKIERLMLEAIYEDIIFDEIDDYMVSDFTHEKEIATTQTLFQDGMIKRVSATQTGYQLTKKGSRVLNLPFSYDWCKIVIDASKKLQMFIAMAASCGNLYNYRDFEREYSIEADPVSELITKIKLVIDYWNMKQDDCQRDLAQNKGLSFRRLEQVETQFLLALQALNITPPDYIEVENLNDVRNELIKYFVQCGLFEVFLLQQGKKGWSMTRQDPDGEYRMYMPNKDCALNFSTASKSGFVGVIGQATWFTAQSGKKLANINNLTVIPDELLPEIVNEMASKQGWKVMEFTSGTAPDNTPQMECVTNGHLYIAHKWAVQPEEYQPYYVSIGKQIVTDIFITHLQFPVLD